MPLTTATPGLKVRKLGLGSPDAVTEVQIKEPAENIDDSILLLPRGLQR